jgi:hypothetical protein
MLVMVIYREARTPVAPMNQHLSSLRQQLAQAQQLLPGLLEVCFERTPLLPGSVYTLRRKCGKPSCRCARGHLHPSTVLSYRGEGRSQNISPAAEHVDSLRIMTEHYRQCRQARVQLRRWFVQLLQLVDALQDARVQLGNAQFRQQLPPKASSSSPSGS